MEKNKCAIIFLSFIVVVCFIFIVLCLLSTIIGLYFEPNWLTLHFLDPIVRAERSSYIFSLLYLAILALPNYVGNEAKKWKAQAEMEKDLTNSKQYNMLIIIYKLHKIVLIVMAVLTFKFLGEDIYKQVK